MAGKNKRPPKINESEYLKVAADEQWLHVIAGKDFYDEDFLRIIDFFVLHSPCKVSSYSPKTIESLGWKNPWQSKRFRTAFDNAASLEEDITFFHHNAKNHFLEMWNNLGKETFFEVNGTEYAVVIHAGESNPRMDLLHHIRNAFAHGRFAIKRNHNEYYIFMEDVSTIYSLTGLYVTARICLKKSSLLQLIDFLEKKTKEAKNLETLYIE